MSIEELVYNEIDKIQNELEFDSIYQYNGITVPRVSYILKSIVPMYIVKWANSLGFKRISYDKRMEALADEGTIVHNQIDSYLKGNSVESPSNGFKSFMIWLNNLREFKVLGNEMTLSCKYFGGTLDLLITVNGRNYIVDFKTSKNVTDKHFMQLSAYKILCEANNMPNIDGLVILQLNKEVPSFNEYMLRFDICYLNDVYLLARYNFTTLLLYYYYHLKYEKEFEEFKKRVK